MTSVCSFLEIGSLDFSEFWHGARNPYEIVHDSPIFGKKSGPKIAFFEFKEKFGH